MWRKIKWTTIKNQIPNLNLHFVGKLQSNKAKDVVKLFDYVHSLENIKHASGIIENTLEINKHGLEIITNALEIIKHAL